MPFDRLSLTRRQFWIGLVWVLGATGLSGCNPEGVGSVKLRPRGGKHNALTEKGEVSSKTRPHRVLGPNDMKPAHEGP